MPPLAHVMTVAGALTLALAIPARGADDPNARAPSVTVVVAERAPIRDVLVVTGSFQAREEVIVASEIDGLAITEVLAEEGDHVSQGQVLARLNRDTIDAQLAQNAAQAARADASITQARAQIAEAEANQLQAEAALQRTKTLQATGAATTDLLDQRLAAQRVAVARLNNANQALLVAEADKTLAATQRREIEVRLARTEIRAKAGGIVSRRTARLGMMAMSAADPLFRIIADGAIDLEAEVPDTALARLAVGQPAVINPIGNDTPLEGRVRLISPEVNQTTRLGRVRIAVTDPKGLAIGSFGRGTVELARSEGLLVPLSAVQFAGAGPSVQVVSNGVVETRSVTVGLRAGGQVQILAGLRAGEEVVAISGTFVRDGDRVRPVLAER